MNRRGAFTLIELMAAMVLTVLLTAAVFRVVAASSRDRVAAARTAGRDAGWVGPTLAAIRRDLADARSVTSADGVVRIATTTGIDPRSFEVVSADVDVEYRVETLGARRWLVRAQSPHTAGAGPGPSIELVAAGVERVLVDQVDPASDASSTSPLPGKCVVTLVTDGTGPGVVRATAVIR